MKKIIAIAAIVVLAAVTSKPAEAKTSIIDPNLGYDSLVSRWYEKHIDVSTDRFFREFVDIDSTSVLSNEIPDSIYISRLRKIVSPINLPYNDVVKRYIGAYTGKRELMGRIMGLSQYYFPRIEQELSNADIPVELRMLAVIESALNPSARSRVGATGMWQFMYTTGKHYGLEVNSFVDERCDVEASTKAACLYLKELHRMFGDWTLALAAYNCGPGNVNKALKRAGGNAKTYWDIYPFLPKETRGYVPSFVAATYTYTYFKQHNIEPTQVSFPLATDTVQVSRLMHLEQVSSTIGVPMETLRALNPVYKLDIIPAVEKSYVLTLPQYGIPRYIDSLHEITAKDTLYLSKYITPDGDVKSKSSFTAAAAPALTHRVKKGDTLGAIARKYGTSASQIAKMNSMRSINSPLRIGQTLRIMK